MALSLTVKEITGRRFQVNCELSETVRQLKDRILELPEFTSAGITSISLFLGPPNPPNIRMIDSQTLAQAGVDEKVPINLLRDPRRNSTRGNPTGGRRKRSLKRRASKTRKHRL